MDDNEEETRNEKETLPSQFHGREPRSKRNELASPPTGEFPCARDRQCSIDSGVRNGSTRARVIRARVLCQACFYRHWEVPHHVSFAIVSSCSKMRFYSTPPGPRIVEDHHQLPKPTPFYQVQPPAEGSITTDRHRLRRDVLFLANLSRHNHPRMGISEGGKDLLVSPH